MTNDVTRDLLSFVESSPTPYHAVQSARTRLGAAGFQLLDEREDWNELGAGRYLVDRGDGILLALVVPAAPVRAFRIVGAHTDSPNLRLKAATAKSGYVKEGYQQLGVEVYGGALLNSWLDRDLALAGRALVRRGDAVLPWLVRLDDLRVRVPQLAIHLDRDVNEKGLVLNKQEHLAPVVGLASRGGLDLDARAAEKLAVPVKDIVATEWMLFDTLAPALGGAHQELIFSARMDNLAMSHAAIVSLGRAAQEVEASDGIVAVAALFDHEEIGSQSAYGAESAVVPRVLERLSRRRGRSFDEHARALARSVCLSADMAHAVHPNYESRHEPRHKPVLNGGPVLKRNAQQRYATSARTGAYFLELCASLDVPVQEYVNRTDLPCGSTIGPITSTLLGVPTADIGNAMLSMHSAREMAGADDPETMTRVLTAFYPRTKET